MSKLQNTFRDAQHDTHRETNRSNMLDLPVEIRSNYCPATVICWHVRRNSLVQMRPIKRYHHTYQMPERDLYATRPPSITWAAPNVYNPNMLYTNVFLTMEVASTGHTSSCLALGIT